MPTRRPTRWKALLSTGLVVGLALGVPSILTPASAADPVAGAQTSGDSLFPNVGNGGYDVQHYDLDYTWTPGTPVISASSITATAAITAKTTASPLSSFSLDFEGLTVNSVTVDGAPATWERVSDLPTTKHKLIITPAAPVNGEFTTVVAYSGAPTTHIDPDGSREGWVPTADGATAVNEPVGAMTWYPSNNVPTDKATFDISVTAPRLMDGETMGVASNGILKSRVNSADRTKTTWNWHQPNQMATYLSMISIGKYEMIESTHNLESGPVRDWTFLDTALSASQRATTMTSLAYTEQILRWMESHFGPYPGASAGAVVDITSLGYALETQDRSYYERSVSRGTLIHEIAHQWFGNAVSPSDWSDLWLNEGPGDYMPRAFNVENGLSTTTPETSYYNTWSASSPTAAMWSVPLAGFTNPAILFNYVYSRGGQTLEALRTTVGDEKYFEIMRTWIAKYNGGDASTADFVAHATEKYGKNLAPLFATWAYGVGKPAWPSRWTVDLTKDVPGPVAAGSTVNHTLTVANTGKVALTGATVRADVTDVLDDATINPATLPAGVTLSGNTLTWAVPSTPAAATGQPATKATVSFPAVVNTSSSGGTLTVTTSAPALGASCVTCTVTSAIVVQDDVWVLGLSSDPMPGDVEPGDRIEYTLTARNDAAAALRGGKAEVDLADVLDDATIAGALGAGLDLAGDTLTWSLPPMPPGTSARAKFTVEVGDASSATLKLTAAPATAGGVESPSLTHTVGARTLTPTAVPVISGAAKVNGTLSARTGTWRAGTAFTYAWSVGGRAVPGATAATYTLRPADVGKTVTVAVTGSLSGWAPATTVSRASAKVAPAAMVRKPRVFLTGLPKVGKTLRVNAGRWDTGVTLRYQWFRGAKQIPGARGKAYKLRKTDQGKRIHAKVVATKTGYTTVTRATPRSVKVLKR